MAEIADKSLHKIAKGTGIVLFGTIVGMFLGFGGRIMLARLFSTSDYGIYSLALVIFNIVAVVSTLGFQQGTTRQIAYYRGKGESRKTQVVVTSSLQIVIIASLSLSTFLFITSDIISVNIFHEPELSPTIKIFSIAVPFFSLINIFVSIFAGFDQVKPRVYFQNILRNGLFPLLLIPVILIGLSFTVAIYAFTTSIIITSVALILYTTKKYSNLFSGVGQFTINLEVKKLLLFSLPLLLISMLNMIIGWTDTLMLGLLITATDVGLYNAALPLSQLIGVIFSSLGFIYVPIVSQLFSKELLQEIRSNYQVITKWIFFATLPFFLTILLFPKIILDLFFGPQYVEANTALQFLSVAVLIHIFLGPNGLTLLAMGKSRPLIFASLLAMILNIFLNFFLIPVWGILGAAIATTLSNVAANVFNSIALFRIYKIHPFSNQYLRPIVLSILPIILVCWATNNFLTINCWILLMFIIFFSIVITVSILLTKSVGYEDISLITTISKQFGKSFTSFKHIFKYFK
ncbi:flippase [Chloroflexota bacterium]